MFNKNSIYELAVWRAKELPNKNQDLIISKANRGLAKLTGFVKRIIYQSLNDPQLFFDWVEWDTLENAESAVKNMMTVPELKEFVSLIGKTIAFEHYTIEDTHINLQEESNIVELVVYKLKTEANIATFKRTYSENIGKTKGYQYRYILRNSKGENQWAEFVHWQSIENAKVASETMQKSPEIGKAFSLVENVQLVHQYFQEFK